MPNPRKGDSEDAFVQRYMASAEARKSYPDDKQRYAVAKSKWRNRNKKQTK